LYRIAAHARTRVAATVGVLALTGPLATGLPDFSRAGGVVPFAMSVVIAWTVGYAVGQRRGYAQEVFVHQLVQQRMGLARELHDVVAHSMSVIAVQAGYGHLVGPDKPDQAFAALAVIESTSRQTLTELRQLLGVLRQGATDPPLIPTPGVADIDRLIEQAAAGGVRVSLRTSGDLDLVPAGVGLAAYRIVQESLTNVIKHAGTGTAQVRISCDGGGLLIEVTDDGAGRDDRTGSDGHGLVGMRERAAMYGGWVRARPVAGHGFHVVAQLPLNGTAA
jgi:signal transduction histidine kinase